MRVNCEEEFVLFWSLHLQRATLRSVSLIVMVILYELEYVRGVTTIFV